mmetsp:Transcript_28859/g.72400  ORF Transcript_28859/g.72400 Transcript_28859/m.72400 type:complete len:205 (-) Transcript_28859:78-692(-)
MRSFALCTSSMSRSLRASTPALRRLNRVTSTPTLRRVVESVGSSTPSARSRASSCPRYSCALRSTILLAPTPSISLRLRGCTELCASQPSDSCSRCSGCLPLAPAASPPPAGFELPAPSLSEPARSMALASRSGGSACVRSLLARGGLLGGGSGPYRAVVCGTRGKKCKAPGLAALRRRPREIEAVTANTVRTAATYARTNAAL